MLDGMLFGLVDNGVLLLGAYAGFDLGERLGEGRGRIGAILGALVGNTVSDGLGALVDPALSGMALGVVVGCMLPLIAVPIIEGVKKWRS